MMPEHIQCPTVGRHCVIIEVAADNPPQPFSLVGDRLVHAPSHLLGVGDEPVRAALNRVHHLFHNCVARLFAQRIPVKRYRQAERTDGLQTRRNGQGHEAVGR